MQGRKTQPGPPFLYGLHLGYFMGTEFSINSAMEEMPNFFILLKSHQIREAHMVPEKNGKQPSNQGHHACCYILSFQAHSDPKSHPALSLEASHAV